jgi:hypothetical protein
MMEWLTLKWLATLQWLKPPLCMPTACHLSGMVNYMIIWGGLFAHGDGSTGLMKVVFCYALPTVVQGFGANETLHFRTASFWAQVLLGVMVEASDYSACANVASKR